LSPECSVVVDHDICPNDDHPLLIPETEIKGSLKVSQDDLTGKGGRLRIEGKCFDGMMCNDEHGYTLNVDEFRMDFISAGK
jgi:hypothetical protein